MQGSECCSNTDRRKRRYLKSLLQKKEQETQPPAHVTSALVSVLVARMRRTKTRIVLRDGLSAWFQPIHMRRRWALLSLAGLRLRGAFVRPLLFALVARAFAMASLLIERLGRRLGLADPSVLR